VADVLATCQTLVREAPLREQRWALLARAQYRAGQQADALRTIHHLKGVLARQLGIDPSPDLMVLEQAILQQDPDLAVPESAGTPVDRCPWLGLHAYDVEDADWFFGREPEVADCLGVFRTRRLLAVAGPSGSGKSSLLRAGICAAAPLACGVRRLGRGGRPDGLRTRGLLDADGRFTDAGRATKDRIEALTDTLAEAPYDSLEPLEVEELIALLEPISARLEATGSQ
jgi:hypothetical protein